MRNPVYLTLSRNGVWHFRWPIPKELHPGGKASTVKVSLRTREPKEALRLARFLGYVAPDPSAYRTIMTATPYHVVRKTLHDHFASALERQRQQIDQTGPLSALDLSVLEGSLTTALGAVQGRNSLDLIDGDDDTLIHFIEKYGLSIEQGSEEYELLRKELPKAYRDYVRKVIDLNRSLDSYDYSQKSESSQMPNTGASVTLKTVVQKYLDTGVQDARWVGRSEDQVRQHLDLLQALLGADTEPPLVCRRLQLLRRWSHEQTDKQQVFS